MLLNVRTAYSLLNSTVNIQDYVKKARDLGYQAIGIADYNVLHGVLEFYQACQESGLKALVGITLELKGLVRSDKSYPFIVYAKNYDGYLVLLKISRLANQKEVPTEQIWKLVSAQKDQLVVVSGGRNGEIEQALIHDDIEWAVKVLHLWREFFGQENTYLGMPI